MMRAVSGGSHSDGSVWLLCGVEGLFLTLTVTLLPQEYLDILGKATLSVALTISAVLLLSCKYFLRIIIIIIIIVLCSL